MINKRLVGTGKDGSKYYLKCQVAFEEIDNITHMFELNISNFIYKYSNGKKIPFGNLAYFLVVHKEENIELTPFGEKTLNGYVPGQKRYEKKLSENDGKRYKYIVA